MRMMGRGRLTGIPTIVELLEARRIVARYLSRTPLYRSENLSRVHGCQVYVKYENFSIVRSFKARGAFYSLSCLSERERRVLELRYGLNGEQPQTLDEVGRAFNVTRERIRQIENQSLKKLRALAVTNSLKDVA